MDIGLKETILAVVTTEKNKAVSGEGVPIFYADNNEEMKKIALYISRVTLAMVHDIGNGTYIIVKH